MKTREFFFFKDEPTFCKLERLSEIDLYGRLTRKFSASRNLRLTVHLPCYNFRPAGVKGGKWQCGSRREIVLARRSLQYLGQFHRPTARYIRIQQTALLPSRCTEHLMFHKSRSMICSLHFHLTTRCSKFHSNRRYLCRCPNSGSASSCVNFVESKHLRLIILPWRLKDGYRYVPPPPPHVTINSNNKKVDQTAFPQS